MGVVTSFTHFPGVAEVEMQWDLLRCTGQPSASTSSLRPPLFKTSGRANVVCSNRTSNQNKSDLCQTSILQHPIVIFNHNISLLPSITRYPEMPSTKPLTSNLGRLRTPVQASLTRSQLPFAIQTRSATGKGTNDGDLGGPGGQESYPDSKPVHR
jgi:hypothetical protein